MKRKLRWIAAAGYVPALIFLANIRAAAAESSSPGTVTGNVDGVFSAAAGPVLRGWACSQGSAAPIHVDLYVSAGPLPGNAVNRYAANFASEPAVASACGSTGAAYRFEIPLQGLLAGAQLWVYGIAPPGGGQNELLSGGRGKFTVPAATVAQFDSNSLCGNDADVTAPLQALINASAGGSQVIVPAASQPCTVHGLKLPSNSHLTINGTLQLAPGVGGSVLTIATRAQNVMIDGTGTIDGNRAGQSKDACNASGGCAGVNSLLGSDFGLSGVTIQNVFNWPVNIVAVAGATLSNMTMLNSGSSVEFAAGTSGCAATGLTISGIDDEGFAFYGGVSNCSLTNSTITNSAADGVSVLSDGSQKAPSHDIRISDIQAYGNGISGISAVNGIGASGTHYNITITGGHLHDNNTGNHGGRGGVFVNNATNVTVSNVTIDHDGNGPSASYGIYMGAQASNVTIKGATIFDEGQGGTLGVGLALAGASNVTLEDSNIYDHQKVKTMAFDINGASNAPGFVQTGNTLQPSIGPRIQ